MFPPVQVYMVFGLFTFLGAFLSYIWCSTLSLRPVMFHIMANRRLQGQCSRLVGCSPFRSVLRVGIHLSTNIGVQGYRPYEGIHSGLKFPLSGTLAISPIGRTSSFLASANSVSRDHQGYRLYGAGFSCITFIVGPTCRYVPTAAITWIRADKGYHSDQALGHHLAGHAAGTYSGAYSLRNIT